MIKRLTILLLSIILCSLTSCYRDTSKTNKQDEQHDALIEGDTLTQEQQDSISFYTTHHFTEGYNFQVYSDSISLLAQQPEEMVSQMEIDTFSVYKDHHVVVGDIRTIPQDSIDSVWVQLATDEGRWGWIHETELLPNVVPEDPISQAIMFFSSTHIIISLIIVAILGMAYVFRHIRRRNIPMVHFHDISSFYPTLLCLNVAFAATFYASVQVFAPETWRHFYYHPTLNPFQVPFILSIFMSSVWAMVIVFIAAIDDVRHHLPYDEAFLYIFGMIGVCAVDYILFSITTLYYVGYPLLVAYTYFAIKRYFTISRRHYICGKCGNRLARKGKCPVCGAINE